MLASVPVQRLCVLQLYVALIYGTDMYTGNSNYSKGANYYAAKFCKFLVFDNDRE